MKAAPLFAKDDLARKRAGWGAVAFIAPKIPKPQTTAEKAVQGIFNEILHDPDHAKPAIEYSYTLHIYTVLELMEAAWSAGYKYGRE
jgi:hypothetical protein